MNKVTLLEEKKVELLRLFQEIIEEEWKKNRLDIIMNLQSEMDADEVQIMDISYSIESDRKSTEESWVVFTFHFSVKGETVGINFFTDREGEYYDNELAIAGAYDLINDGGMLPYIKHFSNDEQSTLHISLLKTLQRIRAYSYFGEHLNDLFELRNGYQHEADKAVYEEYKSVLSGIVGVSGTGGDKILLTFESGLRLYVDKNSIICFRHNR